MDEQTMARLEEALHHLHRASELVGSLHDRYLHTEAGRKIAEATGVLGSRMQELQAQAAGASWPPEPENYW